MTTNELSEFARRLKFLRDRDQVTISKLAQMTHYDKDRLRDFEMDKAIPKDWEVQTIAEVFHVKPDYFGAAFSEGDQSDAWTAPPVDKKTVAGVAKKGGKAMDFSDFGYFKEGEKKAEKAPPRPPPEAEEPLPPDLFDDSASIPPLAAEAPQPAPAARAEAKSARAPKAAPKPQPAAKAPPAAAPVPPPPPPKKAPAPPPPPPPKPKPEPEEPAEAHEAASAPTAGDARVAALETLAWVKALTEVLLANGLFTKEDFLKALRRHREG